MVDRVRGVDLEQMLSTTPGDPEDLLGVGADGHELELPSPGYVPRTARRLVVEALGESASRWVTVGLYGGYGRPGDYEIGARPIEISGLAYWFGRAAGPAFFEAWAMTEYDAGRPDWDDLVTFVWPDDHRWLLCTHPDLSYTEVYGDAALMKRLRASSLEVVEVPVR